VERNTVDLEAWAVMPETRLYAADKGRKPFAEMVHSRIAQVMEQF
jgi:hypothetical protein